MRRILVILTSLVLAAPLLVSAQTVSPSPTPDVTVPLPGDGFRFWRENAWLRIQEAFTFQAERKADLLEKHLQKLDEKLTACVELGDADCEKRIQERIDAVKARTEKFLSRKEAVLAAHRERFEEWLKNREARLKKLDQRLEERVKNHEELMKQRFEKRSERLEQRQENREKFVEELSPVAKKRLKNTEEKIEQHNQEVEQEIEDSN